MTGPGPTNPLIAIQNAITRLSPRDGLPQPLFQFSKVAIGLMPASIPIRNVIDRLEDQIYDSHALHREHYDP